ncbi:GNAT family N-acetyltransferase [Polyangium jinanense]|uniref:GNAT family N-acetyltransferase n=1 Tax=Polyangium jinanense TaxID=2829994 RepID=A0A9X3X3M0_9BACT|nr:GNAT family N-acetyltransferase [Polyangium jinanense]MDC3956153.1 GNAT family N-acetyltransferase [Polyangium jinanense]MDC3983012.1 GNAT family N-acetyltransferase [Polyangium jinanense]
MTLSPPVLVRPAKPEDVVALGRMGTALVQYHHSLDPLRFCLVSDERGYGAFLASEMRRQGSIVLVAEARGEDGAGRVVGYAWGRLEGRDWALLLDAYGALHDLYVEPEGRRLGAGRALCEGMIQRLSELGAPRVVLSTASKNEAAQRLFASLGFRATMTEMTRERSS